MEKNFSLDHHGQKPWFSEKPTSEHFERKCPLDKRKSLFQNPSDSNSTEFDPDGHELHSKKKGFLLNF